MKKKTLLLGVIGGIGLVALLVGLMAAHGETVEPTRSKHVRPLLPLAAALDAQATSDAAANGNGNVSVPADAGDGAPPASPPEAGEPQPEPETGHGCDGIGTAESVHASASMNVSAAFA